MIDADETVITIRDPIHSIHSIHRCIYSSPLSRASLSPSDSQSRGMTGGVLRYCSMHMYMRLEKTVAEGAKSYFETGRCSQPVIRVV